MPNPQDQSAFGPLAKPLDAYGAPGIADERDQQNPLAEVLKLASLLYNSIAHVQAFAS
jgi:hypothetical protein